MLSYYALLSSLAALTAAQLCAPGCQSFSSGCGGCGAIRAYRLPPPPMMMMMAPIMRPAFSPCGGSPCGPQLMQPCGGGGCGNNMQQVAYGIPDPIITDSGRVIRAPFLPPPALPPQGTARMNFSPIGK